MHTAHIAAPIRWRRADEWALRGRCSVYLRGGLTMSVGMAMCRCWALHFAVDGNGIILVCSDSRLLLRRERVLNSGLPLRSSAFVSLAEWRNGRGGVIADAVG